MNDDPETVNPASGQATVGLRLLWFVAGWLFLALGTIGAVLPLLPTTPFVILAALAFGKSSPRVKVWLHANRIFGPILHDWETHRAIARRHKILACTMMALTVAGSALAGIHPAILLIQALLLASAATYVLTRPGHSESRPGPSTKN